MNKILKYLSLFLVTLVGLSACNNESLLNNEETLVNQGNTISFTLPNTPSTYAKAVGAPTVTQTPALDREKAVESVYAVLFNEGKWFKTVKATPAGGANYTVPTDVTGTFDMYLVANPAGELVTKLQALTSASNVDDYEKIVATQKPGEDNTASNFLMTSEAKHVVTTSNTVTNLGVIKLVRLAARFDLYNTVPSLKITKIKMNNRYEQSRMARGALNGDMSGLAEPTEKVYQAAQGVSDNECVAAMYSYENMYVGGTTFELEGTYKGKPFAHLPIILENLPVKRNHLYSIIISALDDSGAGGGTGTGTDDGTVTPDPSFGKLNVEVKVKDWEAGETIEYTAETSKMVPSFSAKGATGLTETQDPTKITLAKAANTVTLTVKGVNTKLVYTEGTLPTGYTHEVVNSTIGGVPSQTFTITLPENKTYTKELPFELQNALTPQAKRSFTIEHTGVRVKLPIEYVADFNVAEGGRTFAKAHTGGDIGGYFSQYDAWSKFKNITIDGKAYHLPTAKELMAISAAVGSIQFTKTYVTNDVSEEITVKKETKTYTADYKGLSSDQNVVYAIKFKGNGDTYKCAYRYEIHGDMHEDNHNTTIAVTVRYLGSKSTTIEEIAKESFWNADKDGDVVKKFSASGIKDGEGTLVKKGQVGYISSADWLTSINTSYGVTFTPKTSIVYNGVSRDVKVPARLFSDK